MSTFDWLSLILYTHFPIWAYRQHSIFSLQCMFGFQSTQVSDDGHDCVLSANYPRSIATPLPIVNLLHTRCSIRQGTPGHSWSSFLLTRLYLPTHHFTWWLEVIPITDITAQTVAQAFLSGWISQFSVPSTVSTYRGHQFESTLWRELMELLESKRIHTTAYHPSANGLIE